MTRPPLILASTSRYRRALLDRLQLKYEAIPPVCDEHAFDDLPVEERVVKLAVEKARSVAADRPDAVVIGSDQIPEVGGVALEKPGTRARAMESLMLLAGRTHRLVTGVAVVAGGRVESDVDIVELRMRPLSRGEIEAYVDREDVLDCAGAFKTEGLGIALFEEIRSLDPSSGIGLPLIKLTKLLQRAGIPVLP
ncbi:MAG: septum formation protein Maf [Gemmatimonadetes bacterium]|nr:septum formation protein Maf [Gemmatimonadota bacterium]